MEPYIQKLIEDSARLRKDSLELIAYAHRLLRKLEDLKAPGITPPHPKTKKTA